MKSSEIITAVLNRYKFWASKNPNSASSFIPNANATSFYLMKNRGDNQSHIQIRLSNHGTYLKTWTDRKHLGNSVNRYDPAHSINISIVFVDDSSDITNDCTGQKNCDGCVLPVCKPQTFDEQDQIGRHFKVYQYVYNSNEILPRYINAITKAIFEASYKGVYIDPLRNIQRAAKHKELVSSTELQNIDNNKDINENNMKNNKKQVIRLTESDLHRIVENSVKKMLNELEGPKYSEYDSRGFDRDGFDKNGYDEDGYDRDGWNRNDVHMNGYNREQYANMQNSHKAAKDILIEPSIQLKENIKNYLNTLRNLSKTNKYVDLNAKDTYFYVLNNMLGETCDVLTDTIDFLNDEMMGY